MSVIAFRPRSSRRTADPAHPAVHGTFRAPRGGSGTMSGSLRVGRLVLAPRGAFVRGVFTGELRADDGTLVGVDSRRATVRADLVPDEQGLRPLVRPFTLDLLGIPVDITAFAVDAALVLPLLYPATRRDGTACWPPHGPAA
jgi:hypothetical protein